MRAKATFFFFFFFVVVVESRERGKRRRGNEKQNIKLFLTSQTFLLRNAPQALPCRASTSAEADSESTQLTKA